MKRKWITGIMALISVAVLTGCYTTLDGQMKGGLPWRKDTLESTYERPQDQIFEAATEVLSYNGTLAGENRIGNSLTAKIDDRTVWVKVTALEENLTKVEVQARTRYGNRDIDLASEIDKQIALRLR